MLVLIHTAVLVTIAVLLVAGAIVIIERDIL